MQFIARSRRIAGASGRMRRARLSNAERESPFCCVGQDAQTDRDKSTATVAARLKSRRKPSDVTLPCPRLAAITASTSIDSAAAMPTGDMLC